jgi:integrase
MAKEYRKTIRINGREIKSPWFAKHSDAVKWYENKRREKLYLKEGLHYPIDERTTLADFVNKVWLVNRKQTYPKSTWYSDEQRFRDYVEPMLGAFAVSKINQLQIRTVLRNVVDVHKNSVETRNRVRALLSKIFNDAMNADRPLRSDNPAMNISFNDPRRGKAKPNFIRGEDQIMKFLSEARKLGDAHLAYASIALMAGLRKSEIIPLEWTDFDADESVLLLSKRFMQAANKTVSGLKAGSEESHAVPIPDQLAKLLKQLQRKSKSQYIVARPDGASFSPRGLHELHDEIRIKAGSSITPHGLRHTYGRQFVLNGGSMKALQTILGHSNSSTTERYSELAGKTIGKYRNTVSFDIGNDDD